MAAGKTEVAMQRREVWLMLRLFWEREFAFDEMTCDVSELCKQLEKSGSSQIKLWWIVHKTS